MGKTRGVITTEHTVWCGADTCGLWSNVGFVKGPAADAKNEGWTYTRKRGWLCPIHNKKATPEQVKDFKEAHDIYE